MSTSRDDETSEVSGRRRFRGRKVRQRLDAPDRAPASERPQIPSAWDVSGVWLLEDASSVPGNQREGALARGPMLDVYQSSGRLPVVRPSDGSVAAQTGPGAAADPVDADVPIETVAGEAVVANVSPAPQEHASGRAVVRGTLSMIVREGFLRAVVLVANVILVNVLDPAALGIFVLLGFFNTFLTTFGAFGLGPAIVQRKEEPDREELAALFTFQVAVAGVLVLVLWVLAPWIAAFYPALGQRGSEGVWLIRVMAFSFLLISAAATPVALLERRLAFGRIAVIEMSSGVVYQGVAVVLVLWGFGVWSLVIGTLASAVVWLATTYVADAWVPRFSLRWRTIWPLVRFGLQFQGNRFISLIKDNIASVFVLPVLGAAAVGDIGWATTVAFYPLIIVQLMGRVTFPALARAIEDRSRLQRMVEATVRYQCYVALPLVAALVALLPYLTKLVFEVRHPGQWQPADPLVYYFLVPTVTSVITWPLIAGLNALGRPDIVWRLMLLWLVLDWGFGVVFVLNFGVLGFAVANACVSLTSVVTVLVYKRYQPLRLLRNIAAPMLAMAVTTALFLGLGRLRPPTNILALALEGIAVVGMFVLIEAVIDRHFISDVRYVLAAIFSRVRPRGAPVEAGVEATSR